MGGPSYINGEAVPCTDNFLQCTFVVNGETWTSAEQYFQAAKFPDNADLVEALKTTHDGLKCWELGFHGKGLRKDWDVVRVDVMFEANLAKFKQNDALRDQLLATGSNAFQFPPGTSSKFWLEWNCKLLTAVRELVKPEGCARDESVLAQFENERKEYREATKVKLGL